MWGKKWILHYATPFWITIVLTILFNVSLAHINIVSTQYSFLGMTIDFKPFSLIAVNLCFSILTFFLSLELQRCFLHTLFSRTFINAMNETVNEHFILQAFIVELYRQFTSTPNFLKHIKESTEDDGFQHIVDLSAKIKGNGVKLSTYLYAVLLKESLSQKPSCLYSVWDTRVVNLNNTEEYSFYTDYLTEIYSKYVIEKNNKIRIFITENENTFDTNFPDNLKQKHKEWGFEKIYYCSSSSFQDSVRKENGNEKYDDFIIFELGKSKWIIGKDHSDKKTRMDYHEQLVDNMKKCFSESYLNTYKIINL
jgi:hypothetical protein